MLKKELHELLYPKDNNNGSHKGLNGKQQKVIEYSINDLELDRVDATTEVPDPKPTIHLGGKIFCCRTEICIVSGKPKAGKSNVLIQFAGTAMIPDDPDKQTKYPLCSTFAGTRPIVYIDTEMGKSKTKMFYSQVQSFLGTSANIPQLRAYTFKRHFTAEERLNRFKSLISMYSDAHLWIVDHFADFLPSVNDEKDVLEKMIWLNSICESLNTSMIVVMHENPGASDKIRGHLGSEGVRKAAGTLSIRRDKEHRVHLIDGKDFRHDEPCEQIVMEYDKALKRLQPVSYERAKKIKSDDQIKAEEKRERLIRLARRALLDGSNRIQREEFIKRIQNNAAEIEGVKEMSRTTAGRRIKTMEDEEIIERDEEGLYKLKSIKSTSPGSPPP